MERWRTDVLLLRNYKMYGELLMNTLFVLLEMVYYFVLKYGTFPWIDEHLNCHLTGALVFYEITSVLHAGLDSEFL